MEYLDYVLKIIKSIDLLLQIMCCIIVIVGTYKRIRYNTKLSLVYYVSILILFLMMIFL
jgi:hypothetical protein